jgi:excinuclease ABC subunit A
MTTKLKNSLNPLPGIHAHDQVEVLGARVHNLKNIDVSFPRNKLVVITGISGSGKSSLAFDTIYAEGQRRYIETFASYARSFIGNLERPDVDKINGLSPVIAIEQKTTSKNPRSTVGTVTEIYDYLRLLFAKVADAYSYISGQKMTKQTDQQIEEHLLQEFAGKKVILLAPIVKGRKGHYRELFQQLKHHGFSKVRVDGEIKDLGAKMQVDRYKIHDIEVVIDRIVIDLADKQRLQDSLRTALQHGKGVVMVQEEQTTQIHYFSKFFMDPATGLSYDEPAPNTFSFNSPYGACPTCEGLGTVLQINIDAIIPDRSLSIPQGGIVVIGSTGNSSIMREIKDLFRQYQAPFDTPIQQLPPSLLHVILWGSHGESFSDDRIEAKGMPTKTTKDEKMYIWGAAHKKLASWSGFMGIIPMLMRQVESNTAKERLAIQETYTHTITCPDCQGGRLKKSSLSFKIADKNIAELAHMDLAQLAAFLQEELMPKLDDRKQVIAHEIVGEITKRIHFLLDVGLYYLSLDRPLASLSGGEAQRIRLATQIGTQLVGVLYILDEPSIGLHQRDNVRLIEALQRLRDLGNSVVVVEHDKDMMWQSDYIIDIGPGAGKHGGTVVAAGSLTEFLQQKSVTAEFLTGSRSIAVPMQRRKGQGKLLTLKGCTGHNLKDVTLNLPLGQLICITGVSGSGKSTLIHQTLYPILQKHLHHAATSPLPYKTITGLEYIDKVIEIDQKPIGRTPRSNPSTYTNVFAAIRNLFAQLPEAKIRGYQPGRFSFNVSGGRCETCQGGGMRVIEMEFLPDVYVQCQTCQGKRYNRETLEVHYKGKSISDVLDMTISNAVEFFDKHPSIRKVLKILEEVGLGYLTLGQPATTLSGGEAQRVKLATELAKRDTGRTLYILDEPTTGLHFQDIQHLLNVLNQLTDKGNTVLIIEHNLDIIKVADHIIDMGPEGGDQGGQILVTGTPEEIILHPTSHTAQFLKMELQI